MMPISKDNCLKHYKWGENCDGWNFLDQPESAIKQELMPAHTSEILHYHQIAQQFFYILKGEAKFIIEDEHIIVGAMNAIRIAAGDKHKIMMRLIQIWSFYYSPYHQPNMTG